MKSANKKLLFFSLVAVVAIFLIWFIYQAITTTKAHQTFESYCKWRGLEIENKSDSYGYCKDQKTGKEYKMVLFNGKWYLDGDLPGSGWF